MKFFLCSNEGLIGLLIKSDISQDGSCDKWSDLFNLNSECITEGSTVIDVVGLVNTTSGIYYFPRQILNARTRLASDSKSGRLFMQSNFKYYLIMFPFASFYVSSQISIPNSKPNSSSQENYRRSPMSSKNLSLSILRLGIS